MKYTLSIVAILAFHLIVEAQKYSQEFELITKSEIELETYPSDQEADAVVLLDRGESKFIRGAYGGFEIQFTRVKRIKILKNSGLKHATISIPYYQDGYGKTELIKSIEGYSYNMVDGRLEKTALKSSAIHEEQINELWKVKKFAFPNVKEGTIIEFKYVHHTPFFFNLPDWNFQDEIPTVYSEYTLHLIPFYEYTFITNRISRFDKRTSREGKMTRQFGSVNFVDMIYTFAMEDVPAFKDESYITSTEDYLMKIDFQLAAFHSLNGSTENIMTTWPELCEELLDNIHFGKYISKSQKISRKLLEELNLEGKSDLEKSREIIRYVRNTFHWNEINSKYARDKAKAFVKSKSGNSAEINLFLIGMLREAGIETTPVILSTREHGKVNDSYPFSHFFNYVVPLVSAEGEKFLTDGTEFYLAYNQLPIRCINEKGLLVRPKKKEIQWVGLNKQGSWKEANNLQITLNPELNEAKVSVYHRYSHTASYFNKKKFANKTERIKEHFEDEGISAIENVETKNYKKNESSYAITYEGMAEIDQLGNQYALKPFLNLPMQENLLTQKNRTYPVDFIVKSTEGYTSSIEIPEGYAVSYLPEHVHIDDRLVKIKLTFKQEENEILAIGEYHFKKAIYSPNDYKRLKHHLKTIVERFNESIVFEKVEKLATEKNLTDSKKQNEGQGS